MEYKKPEIVELAEAICAVQGAKTGQMQDSVNIHLPKQTAAAYEADE